MSMNEKEFILMVQYAMERDTITEIARKLSYSRNTIYKKFDEFEIPFTPSERNVESMATLSPLLADIQFDMKTLNELELAMEDWMTIKKIKEEDTPFNILARQFLDDFC